MKISPNDTTISPARAMDPERFRAQATGVGQTARASRLTGGFRAQKVIDTTDADCRALIPEAEGYPPSMASDAFPLPGAYVGQPAMEQSTQGDYEGMQTDLGKRLK